MKLLSDPFHGITKESQENADVLALEIFKEKKDIELIQKDLDQTDSTNKNDQKSN